MIWTEVKAEVAKNNNTFKITNVEKLAHAAIIDAVTQKDWEKYFSQAEKFQNDDNEKNILRDVTLEPIIITLQDDNSYWDDKEDDEDINYEDI